MSASDPSLRQRRRWLPGLASGILALSGAAGAESLPVPADGFGAPVGEQVLTRILRRPLADGGEVVSTRIYAVRFVPDADGFVVEGREIGNDVQAPARLAALVSIERQHRDEDMFPMRLDSRGLIVGFPGAKDGRRAAQAAAGGQATTLLATAPISDDERAASALLVRRFFDQITVWPSDLFRPTGPERRESRDLHLPDGSSGRVTVVVSTQASGAMMRRFDRVVTTEAGGRLQRSTETWLLQAPTG